MSARIVCGIYRIRNTLNGRVYVGSAVNIADRWGQHRLHLNRGSHHCPPLQHAWVKHGAMAFVFEVIEAVESNKKALVSREQVYLNDALAAGLAYNICPTAYSCLGLKRSAEHRAKIAVSLKIFLAISASRIGRKHTAETKAKISASNTGRHPSVEHRAKLSASLIGRKGHDNTSETRAKIMASLVGKKHTVERRANQSLAQKRRFATTLRKGEKRPCPKCAQPMNRHSSQCRQCYLFATVVTQ